MANNGSLEGLSDEVQRMDVGDTVARVWRQPVASFDAAAAAEFGKRVNAYVAAMRKRDWAEGRDFTVHSLSPVIVGGYVIKTVLIWRNL